MTAGNSSCVSAIARGARPITVPSDLTSTSPLANASGAVRAMSTHNTNQRPYVSRKGNRHNKARRLASITEREQRRARRNHARAIADWFEDAHGD